MPRDQLIDAAEELRHVSGRLDDGDVKSRLVEQADQLSALAEAESGPDHGRLARHMHALSDLQVEVDEALAEHVGHAHDEVKAYRETVEGV